VQNQPSDGFADLAEKTLNAVASVRARMSRAVRSAEEVDRALWQTEKSIGDLPVPPQEAQPPQDQAQRSFVGAQADASAINLSLRDAQHGVVELRDELTAGAAALTQAKGFLDELENLPDEAAAGQQLSTARMRERLTELDTAIAAAAAGAEKTAHRLDTARKNVQPLVPEVGGYNHRDPVQGAALAGQVGDTLRRDFSGLQAGVGTAYAAHVEADRSTAEANELAIAVRAASNPTPKSAGATPAAAPEDSRRDRSGGQVRGRGRDV
jgi:hypothetical protein